MTQESRTQATPTPALEPGELPAAALVRVVGGTEGPPGGPGDHNGRR